MLTFNTQNAGHQENTSVDVLIIFQKGKEEQRIQTIRSIEMKILSNTVGLISTLVLVKEVRSLSECVLALASIKSVAHM